VLTLKWNRERERKKEKLNIEVVNLFHTIQKDKKTDGQTDRWINGLLNRWPEDRNRWTVKQVGETGGQRHRWTEIQRNR
jgi:hypothetical protein